MSSILARLHQVRLPSYDQNVRFARKGALEGQQDISPGQAKRSPGYRAKIPSRPVGALRMEPQTPSRSDIE